MAIDFGDLATRYAQRRWDQATLPVTDPEAYLNNRLQQNFGVDLNGNTAPVSTTIKYNTDTGAPESVTTKHEVGTTDYSAGANYGMAPTQAAPALGLQMPTANPVGMQMPQAVAPQAVAPTSVTTPDAQAIEEQRRKQLEELQLQQAQAQAQNQLAEPTGPAVPTVEREAPQATPAAPIAPGQAAVNQVNATQLPQPRPGVQVAGGPAGTGVAQAAAAQSTTPTWQTELETAQTDPAKLWAYMNNTAHPEDARKLAAGLYARQQDIAKQTNEAVKTFTDAFANGDVKKQNQIMRDLRKNNEEGSLIKAVLYARLGLGDLARQEQMKLGAGNKIGRMLVNGQSYAVDTDATGFVKRAWNADGTPADDTTLSMLNASGTLQGTHQYSFTGETQLDPKTGQEVRQRQNNINGTIEYVYVTGPKQGEVYKGGTPIPKSVQTAATKQENKERISANWAGPIAANRAAGTYAGNFNQKNDANVAIRNFGGGKVSIIDNNAGGVEIKPDKDGNINFVPNSAKVKTQVAPAEEAAATTVANTIQQPKFREPGFENESASGFEDRKKNFNEANKKIAGRTAETVAAAGQQANTIKQAQHAIELIDSDTHYIGPELSLLKGRGPVASAIGKQFETDADANTRTIMDTVRSIGGAASQGAIKGHLTNDQLKFLTENKPTEKSSPKYVRQWLEKSIVMIQDAQRAAEAQARTGGAAPNPVLAPPGSRDNPVKLD